MRHPRSEPQNAGEGHESGDELIARKANFAQHTPSLRSAGRIRCWNISAATRIGWPSATKVYRPSTANASPCQYKDYRRNGGRARSKRMTLDGLEFVRRFMLHALPPGFQRIRHYGILASSQKRARLLLAGAFEPLTPEPAQLARFESLLAVTQSLRRCPQCRVGAMEVIEYLAPSFRVALPSTLYDTS